MLKSMSIKKGFKPGIWLTGSLATGQSEAMLENIYSTNMDFNTKFICAISCNTSRELYTQFAFILCVCFVGSVDPVEY